MTPDPILERLRQALGGDFSKLPGIVARGAHKGLPADLQAAIEKGAAEQNTQDLSRTSFAPASTAVAPGAGQTGLPQDHPIMQGLALLAKGFGEIPAAMASGPGASVARPGESGETLAEAVPGIPAEPIKPEQAKTGRDLLQQFGHDITVGAIKSPAMEDPKMQQAWDAVVRPVSMIGAMMVQGRAVMLPLGYFSKLPRLTTLLEQVPARLKEVGAGAVIGGTIDAMRADGLTDDPPWYDPSAKIARKLSDAGLPDRVALFMGGASVGGAVGGVLLGVARGVQAGRESFYMTKLANDPKAVEAMKQALISSGVELGETVQPRQVAKLFAGMRKAALSDALAGTVGDRMAREQYVMNELFSSANIAPSSEDARLVSGIFRTNTGGISLVKGVKLESRPWPTPTVMTEEGGLPSIGTTPIALRFKAAVKVGGKIVSEEAAAKLGQKFPIDIGNAERGFTDQSGQFYTKDQMEKAASAALGKNRPNKTVVEQAADKLGLRLQFMRVRAGEEVTKVQGPAIATANERIVAPAIKTSDGRVFAGGGESHADVMTGAVKANRVDVFPELDRSYTEGRAGFVTSNNRYVSRQEGIEIIRRQKKAVPAARTAATSLDVAGTAEYGKMPFSQVNEVMETEQKTPLYDLLISRPNYEYSGMDAVGRKAKNISSAIKSLAKEQRSTLGEIVSKEAWLLPDGEPVRGGFKITDLEKKARLQKPVISGAERPDLALRIQGQVARMELIEEGRIKIELPTRLTQDQFDAMGRMFDAKAFDEVTLVTHDGKAVRLESPFGAQVQDNVARLVEPNKVSTRLTPQLVQQYKKEGAFDGQAAVLADGTPASIVKKLGKEEEGLGPTTVRYQVRDPLTGEVRSVHPSQITPLPTTLEDQLRPSTIFNESLSDEERAAFARIRQSLAAGLGKKIETFRQLESFASSRGFVANSLGGGKIELTHAMTGELREFTSRKAAIEFVRTANGPMPELTSVEVNQLLSGDTNTGFIGGGGPPPRFGETLPLPWGRILQGLESVSVDRGPGAIEQMIKPSMALMESIDKRMGTNTLPIFMRMQAQNTHMANFVAKWYKGLGSALPEDVMPLQRIMRLGGDANWERVTHLLEVSEGTEDYAKLTVEATAGELKAATELRKWYNAMFSELGVEADYVSKYAPHWRANGNKYGNNPAKIWQAMGNDPVNTPRGVNFFADQYRSGTLDIYDEHAMRVAANYLKQGASNRFMKEAYDDATKYVMMLAERNRSAALPLANVIHAMKGTEFLDQRAAVQESIRSLMEKLPGGVLTKAEGNTVDKLANSLLGTAYASAFALRPSSALRNAFSAVSMSWPIFAGSRSDWLESVGRALTHEGKMSAVEDGAIALKQSAMFMREEVASGGLVPKNYEWLVDKSMFLYDSADEFTRATSYWSGRIAAEKALTRFAKDVQGASSSKIEALKKSLIEDSGMWLHDEQITDDFLRRAANNPDDAARFAGKMASDVTNFLYGRGMQARWMRSVPGRFFGQFGTWSMWYLDYLRRIAGRALMPGASPYRGKAIATLARHALVDAAILAAGHEILDVDLSRWASYGSVFYSGGPGFEVALGASTLIRGLGEIATGNEDPLSQSRVSEGSQTLLQTGRSFLPFFGAAKDAIRFGTSDDPVDRLAAVLGVRPTRDYDFRRKLGLMLGVEQKTFSSDSPVVEDLLNAKASGQVDQIADIRQMQQLRQAQDAVRASPPRGAGANPSGYQGTNRTRSLSRIRSSIPPAVAYPRGAEATKPAESQPPTQF